MIEIELKLDSRAEMGLWSIHAPNKNQKLEIFVFFFPKKNTSVNLTNRTLLSCMIMCSHLYSSSNRLTNSMWCSAGKVCSLNYIYCLSDKFLQYLSSHFHSQGLDWTEALKKDIPKHYSEHGLKISWLQSKCLNYFNIHALNLLLKVRCIQDKQLWSNFRITF